MTAARLRALTSFGLVLTLVIGLALRWSLAGWAWPAWLGDWGNVRSAHSHVGYYGVLFPVVWAAWPRLGLRAPGRRTVAVYGVAVAVSTVGFALQGYALASIVGSTVVLAVWVASTLPLARFLPERDWLATVAPSVWLAALAIPGVAVLTGRGDPLAVPLVRGFLTWLLFGVGAATALRRAGAPAPPAWLHLPAVVGAGLALGPWPHPVAWALAGLLGALYLGVAWLWRGPPAARALWAGLGAGLVVVAGGLVPAEHAVAIGGLHFAVLGPVLVGLAWPGVWARALPLYAGTVGAFALAVAGPAVWPWTGWAVASAVTGTLLTGVWFGRVALGVAAWPRRGLAGALLP